MANYAIQIVYNEYIDSGSGQTIKPRVIILDAVEDSSISASNTITEHPIVSGDMVADHSYKNPTTYQFTGSAAIKGHQGVVVDSAGINLADLEELLLNLKNNAYLCEIVKVSTTSDDDIRFSRYSNMVLESVQFTEKINSLSYTLNFRQVFVVDVQELDVDIDDKYLPNINEPQTTSFTDALIDWTQVDAMVIDSLVSSDLITKDFLNFLSTLGQAAVVAIVGATIAVAIVAKIATALTLTLSNPVGWAIAAITAGVIIVVGLVKGIAGLVKSTKYRVKQFKKYADDKKNNAEVKRFYAFVGEIHKQIEQLNDVISVYSLVSEGDQEAMISIDGNYYIFTFIKNNTSSAVKCIVTNQENETIASIQNIYSSPTNYTSCTSDNRLFRADGSGAYVHLIRGSSTDTSLKNFFICVSKIDPSEYSNVLNDVIKNALTR